MAIKLTRRNPVLTIKKLEKPEGAANGWYINCHCKCGCRMRTNDKLVWCSGADCSVIMTKERFIRLAIFDAGHFSWKG